MIPLRSDKVTLTFPLITLLLILSNIFIFAYQLSLPAREGNFTEKFAVTPTQVVHHSFELITYQGKEIKLILPALSTLITSMFLHGSFQHVAFNMLFLWIFAPNIEDRIGHGRFFLFYLLVGLLGTLTHVVIYSGSSMPLVGASGAIAGIMGGYLMLFPKAKILCLFFIWIIPRFIRLPALIFLGIWIALQFWNANHTLQDVSAVAWFAHIGGFTAGFVLVRLFPKRKRI